MTLHKEVIDPRLKPGTVAYQAAVRALVNPPVVIPGPPQVAAVETGLQVDITITDGTAPFDVDWGDGTPVDQTTSHTYAAGGAYTITVTDATLLTGTAQVNPAFVAAAFVAPAVAATAKPAATRSKKA